MIYLSSLFNLEVSVILNLEKKTALICGASKGIGEAVAKKFSELNANTILLARSEDKLITLTNSLKNSKYISIDISDRNLLKEKITNLINDIGTIDILINNTGGPKAGLISEALDIDFLDAFNNHLLVNSLLSQMLIPNMKKNNYGRIINIISTSVKIPIPNLGVSNTIRAAVASWAKTLSNEVAQYGITVNNVLPGYTDTERLSVLIENASKKSNKSIDEIKNEWINSVPAKRFANPIEVANAVAFLASEQASYINGINLPVDGGRTGCL
jgi:3-oxoacyl-[acyl-carrier protein] reductase